MKRINILMTVLSLICLNGCATKISNSNLYWGDYSRTLYELKKNPSRETVNKHKGELRRIIDRSLELGLIPPPGLQAELGHMLFNEGEKGAALKLIRREVRDYPESKVLMKRIYKQIKEKRKK